MKQLVFIQISPRKHLVVALDGSTAWRTLSNRYPVPPNVGYLFTRADVVHGPASWKDCVNAASAYAEKYGGLTPPPMEKR